jgi:nucleolar protein 9
MNPFASHVIRALLLLLSPNLVASHESGQHAMRSKKSAAWKAKQGPLKSVFKESDGRGDSGSYTPPEVFTQTARKFVEAVRRELDANETRALAADKVASPTLQVCHLSSLCLSSSLNNTLDATRSRSGPTDD